MLESNYIELLIYTLTYVADPIMIFIANHNYFGKLFQLHKCCSPPGRVVLYEPREG